MASREDALYSIATKVSQLQTQVRAQESPAALSSFDRLPTRLSMRTAEDELDRQVQSLEGDKIGLIKRQAI